MDSISFGYDWRSIFVGSVLAVGFISLVKDFFKKRANYKGKVVVITGASTGIGEQLAIKFAKLGSKLVLAARGKEKLEKVEKACQSYGAQTMIFPVDVAIEEQCKQMIEAAVKKFGGIDVLLLNAGVGCLMKLSETTDLTPYKVTMDINFWGYVYPVFYALPYLRQSHGTVIAISSLASKNPTPRRAAYAASKCAVNAFFDVLRVEEPNIQVTIAYPGFVLSDLHDRAFVPPERSLQRNKHKFMSADTAAGIIINAAAVGKREEIMTFQAKISHYLRPFFPGTLESLSVRYSESSIKHE